jgi:hypothetical protein
MGCRTTLTTQFTSNHRTWYRLQCQYMLFNTVYNFSCLRYCFHFVILLLHEAFSIHQHCNHTKHFMTRICIFTSTSFYIICIRYKKKKTLNVCKSARHTRSINSLSKLSFDPSRLQQKKFWQIFLVLNKQIFIS